MGLGILPSSELGLAGWTRKYSQRIVAMRENAGLLLSEWEKEEAAFNFFSCLLLSSKFLGNNFGQCTVRELDPKRDGFNFQEAEATKTMEIHRF